jgi:hypothetical protein
MLLTAHAVNHVVDNAFGPMRNAIDGKVCLHLSFYKIGYESARQKDGGPFLDVFKGHLPPY